MAILTGRSRVRRDQASAVIWSLFDRVVRSWQPANNIADLLQCYDKDGLYGSAVLADAVIGRWPTSSTISHARIRAAILVTGIDPVRAE
jgi:hypothetical protein